MIVRLVRGLKSVALSNLLKERGASVCFQIGLSQAEQAELIQEISRLGPEADDVLCDMNLAMQTIDVNTVRRLWDRSPPPFSLETRVAPDEGVTVPMPLPPGFEAWSVHRDRVVRRGRDFSVIVQLLYDVDAGDLSNLDAILAEVPLDDALFVLYDDIEAVVAKSQGLVAKYLRSGLARLVDYGDELWVITDKH